MVTVEKYQDSMLEESVNLFIDSFTRAPWFDHYDSKNQVKHFFKNYQADSYFLSYVLKENNKIIGLCLGAKKPWIKGMEYYIDQFCIEFHHQQLGLGTFFIKQVEKEIKKENLDGIILLTDKGFPSEKFYRKVGFKVEDDLLFLTK